MELNEEIKKLKFSQYVLLNQVNIACIFWTGAF